MQKGKVIFSLCMLVTGISLLEISAASRFQLNDFSEHCLASSRISQTTDWDFYLIKEPMGEDFSKSVDSYSDRVVVVMEDKSSDYELINDMNEIDEIKEVLESKENEEVQKVEESQENEVTEESETIESVEEVKEEPKEETKPAVTVANSSVTEQILSKTNAERAACGLPALSLDSNLSKVAQFRATECASIDSISHTRPDGSAWYTALDLYGVDYTFCAENLASSSVSSEDVVALWMGSEGHRNNILNSNATKIGIGFAQGANGFYFVQSFSN